MTTFTTGIHDILNNPADHGIGHAVQNTVSQKITDISGTAKQSVPVTTVQNSIDNLRDILIGQDKNVSSIADIADAFLMKSVDQMLDGQAKNGKLSLTAKNIDSTFSTVSATYKNLFDNGKTIMDLRNDTMKNLDKVMKQAINTKLSTWQLNGQGWQQQILAKSKLAETLRKAISIETQKCVTAIFSEKTLSQFNTALADNLKRISKNVSSTLQTSFKSVLNVKTQIQKSIANKIQAFTAAKAKVMQQISTIVADYKQKIANVISDITSKIASSAQSLITSVAGGFAL